MPEKGPEGLRVNLLWRSVWTDERGPCLTEFRAVSTGDERKADVGRRKRAPELDLVEIVLERPFAPDLPP